jgi:hypothetical protein
MKKLMTTLFVLCPFMQAHAAYIPIFDVDVSPPAPLVGEAISIDVRGEAGAPPLSFSTRTEMAAGSIILDVHFKLGITPVVTSWELSENIGSLNQSGLYQLTVNTYDDTSATTVLADTFQTEFTVIPEPSSALLMVIGASGILFASRTRSSCQ